VKQALNEIGPFKLTIDHDRGTMTVDHSVNLLELAAAAGPDGLTADGAAANIFGTEKPTRAQREKARRRLDKLVNSGHLRCHEGAKGRGATSRTAWFVAAVTDLKSNHAGWEKS
jgi:hypothetical protein